MPNRSLQCGKYNIQKVYAVHLVCFWGRTTRGLNESILKCPFHAWEESTSPDFPTFSSKLGVFTLFEVTEIFMNTYSSLECWLLSNMYMCICSYKYERVTKQKIILVCIYNRVGKVRDSKFNDLLPALKKQESSDKSRPLWSGLGLLII